MIQGELAEGWFPAAVFEMLQKFYVQLGSLVGSTYSPWRGEAA